eukprot:scaffold50145_cov49-Cyclotella_meneghiniana.AAC.2
MIHSKYLIYLPQFAYKRPISMRGAVAFLRSGSSLSNHVVLSIQVINQAKEPKRQAAARQDIYKKK